MLNIALKDWLTMIAILLAPWVALLIQEKLNNRKEARVRKLDIFRTLMATRASPLSFEHTRALNMIDIEFYGKKKYKDVRTAWRKYLFVRDESAKIRDKTDAQQLQFNKSFDETMVNLLIAMGDALSYEFDETHIRQSIYKPEGHVLDETFQLFLRGKLVELFSGKLSLPMEIKQLPFNENDNEEQKKLRQLAIQYLEKKLCNTDKK